MSNDAIDDLNEQEQIRREKLARIQSQGIDPFPVGFLDIFADLGMNHMEMAALCDDAELFPDEQLEAIASRLGFGDQFAELLEL